MYAWPATELDVMRALSAGIERRLSRAKWDTDALRDEVRANAVAHLGSPRGVLIAGDTTHA
ncbi:hypothetical protein [Nonomuraea sp. NPDC003754]